MSSRPPPNIHIQLHTFYLNSTVAWQNAGILPMHPAILSWQQYLSQYEHDLPDLADKSHEWCNIYTDGGSLRQTFNDLRACGAGVYFPDHQHLNDFCAVPGLEQSNQRAELYAVLLALLLAPSSPHIHTDSQYVFDLFFFTQGRRNLGMVTP